MEKTHLCSNDPKIEYINRVTVKQTPAQKKLMEVTVTSVPMSRMLGSADELQFLAMLCQCIDAKRTLDIGVYTGYSALTIAQVLPDDGKVIACDISEDFASVGKPFWKEADVAHKIDLRIAPAIETLQSLIEGGEGGQFDFAFIDADKQNYDKYYEACLELLRPGGVIAVDNALWGGKVYDTTESDADTTVIRQLTKKIFDDSRVSASFLSISDGVILARKG